MDHASAGGTTLLAVVQQAFEGRFLLRQELRSGGTSTVYLADDLRSGQRVALKVLLPELTLMLGKTRFHNEIEFLRQLHHPNILPLLASDEAGPLVYFTMPYLGGESLRALIDREGPLPLDRALGLTADVAAALDHAHGQNILHRDVKPDNILLAADRAMVCDFGVARAIERAATERISSSGLLIGTPEYMSPEQARGESALDHRCDIYGLGCLVYEMLSGEVPFSGPSNQAVIARQILDPPRSLRVVRPDLPEAVERGIAGARQGAKRPAGYRPGVSGGIS